MILDSIKQYFERDEDLKVLFVFNDQDPFIKDELEQVSWPNGWRYVEFDGGWFSVKYRLDNDWKDEKVLLFFNQQCPLGSKDRMTEFPLLDVLAANAVYQKQNYATFMQQYNLPQSMTTFVMKYSQQMQGEAMMKLLQPMCADGSINTDAAERAFISYFMGLQRVLGWDEIVLRVILLGRASDIKKRTDFVVKLRNMQMVQEALNQRLEGIFGKKLIENSNTKVEGIVEVMKYNAITQYLSPVDADNYKSLRITDSTAMQQINRLIEFAMSNPKTAAALEEVVTELGGEIRDSELIKWYGTGANYGYMPRALRTPILESLLADTAADQPDVMIKRLEALMIRTDENDELWQPMQFALKVALYYQKVNSLASFVLNTPNEYVESYKSSLYLVDQLYRHVTEEYYKTSPSSVLFDAMQRVKTPLDQHYAKLMNRLNLEWTKCIKDAGGMTSLTTMRQQNFYDSFPAKAKRKVAVIVSDALRYEVAQELIGELAKKKHRATLKPVIAMLPTETKYCKPSLLPHETLMLYSNPDGSQDMNVDHYILDSLAKRSAHLSDYKEGAIAEDYREVAKFNQTNNRELFKHSIVYVFHDTIDQKSHKGTAEDVVNSCTKAIEELAEVVHKIHESYNVKEVYITSDHGFLFNDQQFEEKDKHKVEEETLEKAPRYYLTTSNKQVEGIVKYPLHEVSGMEEEAWVAVPEGTNRLAAPAGGYMFAHGGASLQEMIIPLITSISERENTKPMVNVTILERSLTIQASRLRFHLLQTEPVGMDTQERPIYVALYAGDEKVSKTQELTLDKTEASLDSRQFLIDLTLNKNVSQNVLQLRVYDEGKDKNPILVENVTNKTLVQNDFDDF